MVTRKRILIAATFVLITALALVVHGLVADLSDPRTLIARAPSGTTKLLDRNGRLLYEFLDPYAGSRTRIDLAQIPLASVLLTVTLVERQWRSVRIGNAASQYSWENSVEETPVATQTVTTTVNGLVNAAVIPTWRCGAR